MPTDQENGNALGVLEDTADSTIQIMQPQAQPQIPTPAPPPEIVYDEDEDETALHDYIANLADIEQRLVPVPQWRRKILVRALTAQQRYGLFKAHTNVQSGIADMEKIYADMLIKCCFHPKTGKPVFTLADRGMLMSKNSAAIDTLSDVASSLSGLGKKGQEALAKN